MFDVGAGDGKSRAFDAGFDRFDSRQGNAEDHVSNSMWCAEKSRRVVQNAQSIVATEILLAALGLSLVEDIAASCPLAVATTAVMERIRQYIPACLDGDIWFAADMDAIVTLLINNSIIDSCEASIEWL